ncbi:beta-mannosidase [Flavobacterium sediminis]|uniref:Beta-mannosidase n=1 Tax=Flavobacterium sediminis TaxID=2201181 RepID=A0A2U8QXJ9_9FLAO|nr:glycosyl hydrolase [Flavobacterium sediminis]AWM14791.1 beta-mannosidase [Flavobacterium sediminis]
MKKIFFFFYTTLLIACSSTEESNSVATTNTTNNNGITPQNVRNYMVDPNATDETVALFYNLKKMAETKFAIGQQDAFNSFYNNDSSQSDIKKSTGYDPALLGCDFMFITDDNNTGEASNWFYQQELKIITDAKQAYDNGMFVTFSWHMREPYEGQEFYTSEMTDFQKYNALISLLPGGTNHEYYKTKLDKIATVLTNMKGTDNKQIPVILRLFHEFDGGWFWWGSQWCTAAQYQQLWQFTVEYLRDTKSVHNILYAFSPDNSYNTESQYLSRYPGDTYVDILAMDNYGDFNNQGTSGATTANNKLKMLSDLAIAKKKIAALSETGYQVSNANPPINGWFSNYLYTALTDQNIQIAYTMFWYNTQDAYYVPTPTNSNVNDFVDFTNKPKTTLVNNLPNLYQLPN